jgi:Gas vesicle synthesis protein GvpL/GvpF
MRAVVIGAHLQRDDIEPIAEAVPVGDLFLSGAQVSDDQPLGDRDLLLRVAALRARLLERATFVAIRYGFAVRSSDDAMAKCAALLLRWRRLLTEHRDKVEMTVKVAAAAAKPRPQRRDFNSGADYLRALHEATQAVSVDPRFRQAVSRIGTSRWLHRDNLSLECALLVSRDDVSRVQRAGEQLKREFPDVPFLLSGPWPLEVFADDHE